MSQNPYKICVGDVYQDNGGLYSKVMKVDLYRGVFYTTGNYHTISGAGEDTETSTSEHCLLTGRYTTLSIERLNIDLTKGPAKRTYRDNLYHEDA
jgi:hypothetical protein